MKDTEKRVWENLTEDEKTDVKIMVLCSWNKSPMGISNDEIDEIDENVSDEQGKEFFESYEFIYYLQDECEYYKYRLQETKELLNKYIK